MKSTCKTCLVVALSLLLGLSAWGSGRAAQPASKPATGPASQPTSKPTGPTRFEAKIVSFEEQNRKSPPPKDSVLFVGSSSIVMWKLDKYFPAEVKGINRGFGGSTFPDQSYYFDRVVPPVPARIVVLYCGDNDIAGGRTPQQVADDFGAFVKRVRAALPEARLIYISIKPSLARWKLWEKTQEANKLIAAQVAKDPKLTFLDVGKDMLGPDGKPRPELFIKDGLHMNDEGYKLWTSLLAPLLKDGK